MKLSSTTIKIIILIIILIIMGFGALFWTLIYSNNTKNALTSGTPAEVTVPPSTPAPEVKQSYTYVALGDSYAYGVGATRNNGYTAQYENYLEKITGKKVQYVNLATSGWTSANLLNALKTDNTFKDNLKKADFITFNIVGIDFLQALYFYLSESCKNNYEGCLKNTLNTFETNWTEIIKEIKLSASPSAKIYTLDNFIPFDEKSVDMNLIRKYVKQANDFVYETAAKNNIKVAKVSEKFNGKDLATVPTQYITSDRIHPNDQGHKIIADSLSTLGI